MVPAPPAIPAPAAPPQPALQLAKAAETAPPEVPATTSGPLVPAPSPNWPLRRSTDPIIEEPIGWEPRPATPKNEFSVGYLLTWNVSVQFKNSGSSLFPGPPPGHYDNGYVLQSSRGNVDGYTWNWGYRRASQYDAANDRLIMSRSSVVPGAGFASQSTSASDVYQGVEFGFHRVLWEQPDQEVRVGIEASFSYASMEFHDARTQPADLITSRTAYALDGIHLPPAPYNGTYSGPGPLINNNPQALSSVTAVNGATIVSERTLDLDMFNLRFGPRLTVGLAPRLSAMLSFGLDVIMAHGNFTYHDTVQQLGLDLKGHQEQFSLLPGAYLGLGLGYQFSERWGVVYQVHFQYNGAYEQGMGGRGVQLNLDPSISQTLGISYSF